VIRARLLAVVLGATVAACGHRAAAPIMATPGTALAAALHAPAWSANDVRRLQARLRDAFHDPTLAASGIAIVDASARPLYLQHETRALVPASTFKVLCAAGSMEMLGPRFRFETDLRALDDPRDGAIASDVWLVGSGDPTLTSDDLRGGIGAVVRSGARHIDGALVADASAFSGREVNAAWDPDDLQYGYAAGSSALSLDGGTVEFHLVPSSVGAPARIVVRPAGAVRTLGAVATSYVTSLSIDRAPDRNDFAFGGRIAAGAEQSFWRPVVDMPRYAARVAQSMLQADGVTVRDGVRLGVAPLGGRILWLHRSMPLRDIVRQMLFTSDNHYAEQLLRALGAQRGTGTPESGAAVERGLFTRDGVPVNGLRIVDGSGLATSNRIAPISIATLLARAAAEPSGPALIADLPRVGIEGTVKYRRVTDALGRARAKSGHIENVNALAGYVQTHRHGRVAFSIIVNDRRADDGPVDAGINRALDILARE
jgi:D-alanyl-D-alanine carboxypeptidase/D-alanyl-D-alanine-endopeptidase (penicillin-binding protein 4)